MTSEKNNNGWFKRWIGPGVVMAILASYIGWSAVEIKDNIEGKIDAVVASDSAQNIRMDAMDTGLTTQIFDFRVQLARSEVRDQADSATLQEVRLEVKAIKKILEEIR